MSPTTIFAPVSTPANAIAGLSFLVVGVTGVIFVVVCGLLVYTLARFRRTHDDLREPAQVYGSHQVELAWTVVPMLIVVVLFMATARVITRVQEASRPTDTIQVVAIGHQFWWEYQYPASTTLTPTDLEEIATAIGRTGAGDRPMNHASAKPAAPAASREITWQ
jgi:cytochrome c oxidase subunit II